MHLLIMLPSLFIVAFTITGVPSVCPVAGTLMPSLTISPQILHSVCPMPSFVQSGAYSPSFV